MLILLSVIFLNKLLFFSQSLAQKDFNNIQIPMFQFFSESIKGYFLPPIWNSSFSGGFDAFVSPLSAFFSVFNWILLFSDNIYKSLNLFIFVQICLCAIFSYLMLRVFRFSKIASLLGAVLYTFNGFVVMRLSQGVGIEYLYAYKWLPLIIAFTKKFLDGRSLKDFLGLSISLAMSLEGNINMVIAIGVMWVIYLLFEYKKAIPLVSKLLLLLSLSVTIFAIKLLPFVSVISSGGSRFSGKTGGWRQGNIDWDMFPRILFPIKFNYDNAIFTPGTIGIALALAGFLLALAIFFRNKKPPFDGFYFILSIFLFAFFITIENPFYYFFYSLPALRVTTQIPTFLIFYIVPIVFFGTYFLEKNQEVLYTLSVSCKCKIIIQILLAALPFVIFLEVLTGPSTFGNSTYSFNFPKIDIHEYENFPHYQLLKKQQPGLFVFADKNNASIFFYPYGISLMNLKTIDGYRYFFGSNSAEALIDNGLDELKKRTDYILSMRPIENDSDLQLIGSVSMSKIKYFQSHAVFENLQGYIILYATGWDDDIYIYRVKCFFNCALKNYSNNPIKFSIELDENDNRTNIPTSVAYSKWFKVTYQEKAVKTSKDAFGYMSVLLDSPDENIESTSNSKKVLNFIYVNPFIYIGFIISFVGFIIVIYLFFKAVRKGGCLSESKFEPFSTE